MRTMLDLPFPEHKGCRWENELNHPGRNCVSSLQPTFQSTPLPTYTIMAVSTRASTAKGKSSTPAKPKATSVSKPKKGAKPTKITKTQNKVKELPWDPVYQGFRADVVWKRAHGERLLAHFQEMLRRSSVQKQVVYSTLWRLEAAGDANLAQELREVTEHLAESFGRADAMIKTRRM